MVHHRNSALSRSRPPPSSCQPASQALGYELRAAEKVAAPLQELASEQEDGELVPEQKDEEVVEEDEEVVEEEEDGEDLVVDDEVARAFADLEVRATAW